MKPQLIALFSFIGAIVGIIVVSCLYPVQEPTTNADLLVKQAVHIERYQQAIAQAERYRLQANAMQQHIAQLETHIRHEKVRMVVVADSIAQQPIESTGPYFVSSLAAIADHYQFEQ